MAPPSAARAGRGRHSGIPRGRRRSARTAGRQRRAGGRSSRPASRAPRGDAACRARLAAAPRGCGSRPAGRSAIRGDSRGPAAPRGRCPTPQAAAAASTPRRATRRVLQPVPRRNAARHPPAGGAIRCARSSRGAARSEQPESFQPRLRAGLYSREVAAVRPADEQRHRDGTTSQDPVPSGDQSASQRRPRQPPSPWRAPRNP